MQAARTTVRLTLARHGETQANLEDRWQGQTDSALSACGLAQVAALGDRLRDAGLHRIFASDLGRTVSTAEAVATTTGLSITRDARLRELNVGCLEGVTRKEAAAKFPDALRQMKHPGERIGGGESFNDVGRRAKEAFFDVARELAPGEHALLVTHGGTITSLLYALLGLRRETHPPVFGHLTNTSLTTFEVDLATRAVSMLSFNDHAHVTSASLYTDRRMAEGASVVTVSTVAEEATAQTDAASLADALRACEGRAERFERKIHVSALRDLVRTRVPSFAGHPNGADIVVAEGLTFASVR